MNIKLNSKRFILWRAVDSQGHELDVYLQQHRDKEAVFRFLSILLAKYPQPRVVVTDKLRSYIKPIKYLCSNAKHRSAKSLNNRVENAHQRTRRKEKVLIKFKSPLGAQNALSLMGKVRNIFAIDVGRYTKCATAQRAAFTTAQSIWHEASALLYPS